MENDNKELQLLPIPCKTSSYSRVSLWSSDVTTFQSDDLQCPLEDVGLSLDLQLSSNPRPIKLSVGTEARKWRSSDQIRIVAMEIAYAKRLAEMTRQEMQMAQSEFAYARLMWERAHEEVERVEKMKERATHHGESCLEITCQACRRKFRPY
ncbi:hypothetical protein SSX86_000309 [Deinandra increscens subsp. villosa]|uniref:Uncharacterized protein n=1 Tax=Deinandra increscens subsp. villosa TaxID=3103831 RepID=A0AAP0HDD3_9ASTR